MKVSIDSKTLADALSAVRGAAGSMARTGLLKADSARNELSLSAGDTSLQTTIALPCTVGESGSACLDLEDLASVARHLPKGDETSLVVDGLNLDMIGAKSRFRFSLLDVANFPSWSSAVPTSQTAVPADVLARMLSTVMHAVADDNSTHEYLKGVLLRAGGGKLKAVATDGNRLASSEADSNIDLQLPAEGIIIPSRTAREMARIAQGIAMIGIASNGTVLQIDGGPELMLSTLIASSYPNADKILALPFSFTVDLDRKSFLEAVTRVSAILTKTPIFRVIIDENGLHLQADRDQTSGLETVAPVKVADEARMTLGLNAKYLADALKALTSPVVRLHYSEPLGAVKLTGTQDTGVSCLMMPAKI